MEWDDLKSFLAVARLGSLRDASRVLKTSPATVGRRIASLEDRLGARLFDRTRQGHVLTESGAAAEGGGSRRGGIGGRTGCARARLAPERQGASHNNERHRHARDWSASC